MPLRPEDVRLHVIASDSCPADRAFFVSPRRALANGVLEPEADWLKRCASIRLDESPEEKGGKR